MKMAEDDRSLKETTVRSVGIVYGMVAFNKLLSLIAIVILARILIPRDFGLVGLSAIVIGILTLFKDFGLTPAYIQRAKDIDEAANIVFWSNIAIRLFLYLILFLTAPFAAQFFQEPLVEPIIRIAAISFVIESLGSAHGAKLTKELRFGKIAFVSVITAIVITLSSVILALAGFSFWSLVYASIIGEPVGVFLYWVVCDWRPKLSFNRKVAKDMFVYGRDIVGINILGFGVWNLDNFTVGKIIGTGALGAYTLAYRFGLYSSTNIVSMLGRVLFPVYSKIQSNLERVKRAYLKSFYPISIIVFPVTFGLAILAEEFVYFVLGPNWAEVETPLRILSVYGLFYALAAIGSNVFLALRKQQIPLKILALEVLIMLGTLYPAAAYGGLLGVAIAVTIAITVGSLISLFMVTRLLGVGFRDISGMIVNPLVSSIVMGLTMLILKSIFPVASTPFALELVLGLAVYVVVMRGLSGDDLKNQVNEIVSALRRKKRLEPEGGN